MDNYCLLQGKLFLIHNAIDVCSVDENYVCAISVGSNRTKVLNEDAILIGKFENKAILAIADAHFGDWASHELIAGLAKYGHRISDMASLYTVLQSICGEYFDPKQNSESTLLVVALNEKSGEGFGVSYGDSTAIIINKGQLRRLNEKNTVYVSPNTAMSLSMGMANEFRFKLATGDKLLLFTDGIDECHYGFPATSVTDDIIQNIVIANASSVEAMLRQIVQLALNGVNGNPGGQDNIAIAGFTL